MTTESVCATIATVSISVSASSPPSCYPSPPAAAYLQAYGRCFWNQTAAFLGDKDKYRKPTPPPRPQWCYCKDKNGHQEVCGQHRDKQDCQVPSYPNEFDHNHQFCR